MAELCWNSWRNDFVEGKIWDHPSKMTQKWPKLGGGVIVMVQINPMIEWWFPMNMMFHNINYSTNRIFRSAGFFGYFGENFGIRGEEHHKRATLTQSSPTSFPVIQWQCTLCDKCCCILPGIYTALRFQQPLPTSLAPCLTFSLTFLHTSCKFREFPRYFVHPTVYFECRMR